MFFLFKYPTYLSTHFNLLPVVAHFSFAPPKKNSIHVKSQYSGIQTPNIVVPSCMAILADGFFQAYYGSFRLGEASLYM